MEPVTKCPICKRFVGDSFFDAANQVSMIRCQRCGHFKMSGDLSRKIGDKPLDNSHVFSGAVRELNERGLMPIVDDLQEILTFVRPPRNPIEMIDRILLSLQASLPKAGQSREFSEIDYPIGYANDFTEFSYLIRKMKEMGYLYNSGAGGMDAQIDTHGWRRLAELSVTAPKVDQAFVAMKFHAETDEAWNKGIKPALESTGYKPFRVDQHEHDDKIDDLIIAEIRKSGLLIADFTFQSQGVYFEAGLAMGLGIHAIRCCKDIKDEVQNLHFDTRQYNHILWKNPEDLRDKLINRINAVAQRSEETK